MKKSEEGHPSRNTCDLTKSLTTGHCTQVVLDVADMPDDLGRLLDKGIEDHFRDR